MQRVEHHKIFAGEQEVWQHFSKVLKCTMRFAVFLPQKAQHSPCPVLYWLSGLTCNEQNFITKANAQSYANDYGIIIVAPDTSPRGETIADDAAYDLGQGAGFYINATKQPWAEHYQMFDYISDELPKIIAQNFNVNDTRFISGHSMGGHGALICALKKPHFYQSVSAFAPIVAPSQVPWGQKTFSHYLGDDQSVWQEWDSVALLNKATYKIPILIDQGSADEFLEKQLQPEKFLKIAAEKGHNLSFNMRDGYDHSYYFIASFIKEHIAFHAQYL